MEPNGVERIDILRTYFRDIEEGETKEAALELLKMLDKKEKYLKEMNNCHAGEANRCNDLEAKLKNAHDWLYAEYMHEIQTAGHSDYSVAMDNLLKSIRGEDNGSG